MCVETGLRVREGRGCDHAHWLVWRVRAVCRSTMRTGLYGGCVPCVVACRGAKAQLIVRTRSQVSKPATAKLGGTRDTAGLAYPR